MAAAFESDFAGFDSLGVVLTGGASDLGFDIESLFEPQPSARQSANR